MSETACPRLAHDPDLGAVGISLVSKYLEPALGIGLWGRHVKEWQAADELGLNIAVSEYHVGTKVFGPVKQTSAFVDASKRARILVLCRPVARNVSRISQELAMMDASSGRRVEIALIGAAESEVDSADSPSSGASEPMWESIDLMLASRVDSRAPFSNKSQSPPGDITSQSGRRSAGPPVWAIANTPKSARTVARLGVVNLALLNGIAGTTAVFDCYRRECRRAGDPESATDKLAYGAIGFVGATDADGIEGARRLHRCLRSTVGASAGDGRVATNTSSMSERGVGDLLESGVMFAGSPDSVYRQLVSVYDRVGGFGHLLFMGQTAFLNPDEALGSMTRFATQVLPRVQAYAQANEVNGR